MHIIPREVRRILARDSVHCMNVRDLNKNSAKCQVIIWYFLKKAKVLGSSSDSIPRDDFRYSVSKYHFTAALRRTDTPEMRRGPVIWQDASPVNFETTSNQILVFMLKDTPSYDLIHKWSWSNLNTHGFLNQLMCSWGSWRFQSVYRERKHRLWHVS